MARSTKPDTLDVDGRQVRLTNPDKVLYPAAHVTKREVVEYYIAVAPAMLPHLAGRPVTRKRWPDGVDHEPFFEKNLSHDPPPWIESRVRHQSRRDVRYPLADSPATLAWFAQLAALELHVPQWRFDLEAPDSEKTELNPDRLVLDLDPGPGVGLAECATVARAIRELIGASADSLAPVTSGSKGLHLYLALNGSMTSGETSEWAHTLARAIERSLPDLAVSRMTKSVRTGKVFIDWSQNNAEKTTVAPYSLRGRAEPMVAAPRTWEELDDPDLAQLDFHDVLRRLGEIGDPMADLGWPRGGEGAPGPSKSPPSKSRPSKSRRSDAADRSDRLDVYRSKRNAGRTPEPVPASGSGTASTKRHTRTKGAEPEATFVIQEHHARRLHWDFRLEHGGVLVSWAVPKGMPADSKEQRLAVHTEDHPLEYGSFAGTIPRGEYGAGEVTIWDSGPYRAEKWRDDEVIAVLGGERARGRYALIRTDGDSWLLHRMKDQSGIALSTHDGVRGDGPAAENDAGGRAGHDAARGDHRTPLPRGLSPMLATPGAAEDISDSGWQWEGKWDGVRAIVEVADGAVSAHGRSGADITATYPELAELGDALADHAAALDGEIVALGPGGEPSFGLLQQRFGRTRRIDVQAAVSQYPAHFYAFDILYLDGILLTAKTLADRRRILERLDVDTEHCHVPPPLAGPTSKALAESRRRGLEGIVAKQTKSAYRPGRRPGSWVKIKFRATQDVIVVGWRPGQGRRAGGIGSLLVALPDPDGGGLRYAGRVGTGFDDNALTQLAAMLKPIRRTTSPVAGSVPTVDARDAIWVRPTLVGEVTFAELTADRRLRQASWRGLRPDVSPKQVTVEA